MASIAINTKVIFIYFHGFRLCRVPKKPKSLWFPGVFHSDQLEPHLGTGLSSAAAEELGRGNSDGFRGWKLPVSPGLWWVGVKSLGFLQFILLDLIVLSQTQVVSWWYLDSLQKKCYNCLEMGKLFLVVWEGHISGWWKLSWVPSSKFPSAFICKTFSQSACFPAAQVWLPEVSFCLSSHLCSFLFADHFVHLKIPEWVILSGYATLMLSVNEPKTGILIQPSALHGSMDETSPCSMTRSS